MTDLSAITAMSSRTALTATKSAAETTSTTTDTTSTSDTSSSSLDYDAFLQLMIAQMENQDPTDPMDTSEYMAQLASFTEVEQSILTNQKLDALLSSSTLDQAGSLIGKTATSADGETTGEIVSVKITSEGPYATLDDGSELLIEEGVTIS